MGGRHGRRVRYWQHVDRSRSTEPPCVTVSPRRSSRGGLCILAINDRSLVVQIWEEPAPGGVFPIELMGLSGVDQLRLLLAGKVDEPPVSYLTGMRLTEVGAGSATFDIPVTPWLFTPQGLWAAGAIAILADGPLGCAIGTELPPATIYTTAELSINLVRPVPKSGRLTARGRVVHRGRTLALSEVFVSDEPGRLIAHGTSRCVIFPEMPGIPAPPADVPDRVAGISGPRPYERPVVGTVIDQGIWSERTGREVLEDLISGALAPPPIHYLMGVTPTDAGDGAATFRLPASAWITSPSGFVEGGVTACLADLAQSAAVQTVAPAGTAIAPTDLRVQFIRPIAPDGTMMIAHAEVAHRGRGMVVTRSDVRSEQGKLLALASGSAMLLPGRRADLDDASAELG